MTTTLVNSVEAREEFSDLLNRVALQKERIILTRRGKEIAVLIPIEDWAKFLHSQTKQVLEAAAHALKEAREHGTLSLAAFQRQLGAES